VSGPLVLVVIDGFGIAPAGPGNAVTLARTPALDALAAEGSSTTLQASGLPVGLPDGQMGNSEVGHLNIGAGRVVMQDLPRIDAAIADGSIAAMAPLADFIARLRASAWTNQSSVAAACGSPPAAARAAISASVRCVPDASAYRRSSAGPERNCSRQPSLPQ
jgi:hypothetical protein